MHMVHLIVIVREVATEDGAQNLLHRRSTNIIRVEIEAVGIRM